MKFITLFSFLVLFGNHSLHCQNLSINPPCTYKNIVIDNNKWDLSLFDGCEKDTSSLSLHIFNSNTLSHLDKISLSEVNILYIADDQLKKIPYHISIMKKVVFLTIIMPSAKTIPTNYFQNLDMLENLHIETKSKIVNEDIFQLKNLKVFTILSSCGRSKFVISENVQSCIEKLVTNAPLTQHNTLAISNLKKIKEIVLYDVNRYTKNLENLKCIEKITIFGNLNEREMKKILLLLPNAIINPGNGAIGK